MVPMQHGRALALETKQAKFIGIDEATHNETLMMRLRKQLDDLRVELPFK